jgi:hypothetical protein
MSTVRLTARHGALQATSARQGKATFPPLVCDTCPDIGPVMTTVSYCHHPVDFDGGGYSPMIPHRRSIWAGTFRKAVARLSLSAGLPDGASVPGPMRSHNITLSGRRSAAVLGEGAFSVEVLAGRPSIACALWRRNAAIASSSCRRWPNEAMPISLRSSAVRLGNSSASTSFSRNVVS